MSKRKTRESTHLTPAEELNKRLDDMEMAGVKKTGEWVSMWQTSLRYFFSDQLHGKKVHKDWDWVIVNYIWPSAIQEIAKLAKNYPEILTNPWEDSDTDYAETWQSILQWLWEKGINGRGMRLEQIAAILDGKLFGYRISKIFWEDKVSWSGERKEWEGDVKYRLWHPSEFWASGIERIEDGNCGTVRYVTLDYAIHQWPDFKSELREESVKYKDAIANGMGHIRGQVASAGTYPSTGSGGIDKGLGAATPSQLLTIIKNSDRMGSTSVIDDDVEFIKLSETYFWDYEEVDLKKEEDVPAEELLGNNSIFEREGIFYDGSTNKQIPLDEWPRRTVMKWKEPIYPTGRYVLRAGHLILNPGAESKKDPVFQRYPYSRWPFIISPHYLIPHMWQGTDAVQLYKSSQDMINVTVSHLVNNMKMYGDPKMAIERGAIDSPPGRSKKHYKIGKAAGAIIRLVRGGLSRFKILDPPSPSAAALQLYGLFSQEFKNIVGLQDIAQGKQTKNMTATEAHYLAISANDRISLQTAYEDEWVKQVASLVAEICQKNYSIGRIVRVVGQDRITGATEINQQLKDVKFDIEIVPGTTLPFDKEKKIEMHEKAFAILGQPVPNPMTPEMLRVLEIPGWKKLLDKYSAWQQYVMFLQLYEQVKAGEVSPQEAIQALVQKATEVFSEEQSNLLAREGTQEQENKKEEK